MGNEWGDVKRSMTKMATVRDGRGGRGERKGGGRDGEISESERNLKYV